MSTSPTLNFLLPQGITLRQVANALVQEWLPPFRAEPTFKAARWVLQAVMENPADAPLWEPGISTSDYETRMEAANLSWAVRATAGRSKGIILARLVRLSDSEHGMFQLVSSQSTFPETLFDAGKVAEFLQGQGPVAEAGFFAALLASNGVKPADM